MYFFLQENIKQRISYLQTLKQEYRKTFQTLLKSVHYFFFIFTVTGDTPEFCDTPNTPYMFQLYVCMYIYEHTVLSLHYILKRKIRIKIIIEPNVSLRM